MNKRNLALFGMLGACALISGGSSFFFAVFCGLSFRTSDMVNLIYTPGAICLVCVGSFSLLGLYELGQKEDWDLETKLLVSVMLIGALILSVILLDFLLMNSYSFVNTRGVGT